MPVDFTWVEPDKRIAYYKFVGKWTWDELYEAFHASWDEFKQLNHVVDSISDLPAVSASSSERNCWADAAVTRSFVRSKRNSAVRSS